MARRFCGGRCAERLADWDIVFPDDEREANPASFKFLQMAHKWKMAQASGGKLPALPSFVKAAEKAASPEPEAQNGHGNDQDADMEDASGSDDE